MRLERIARRVRLPVPAAEAFAWHERPGAFERLVPPWERVAVVARAGGIRDGARVVLRLGPLGTRWELVHRDYAAGLRFRDVQAAGPFAHWDHTHTFTGAGVRECELEDAIEYALPLGAAGRVLGGRVVRGRLERLLEYRHRVTADDLAAHAGTPDRGPLRIAVSGAGGLIGSSLVPFLTAGGHEVARLVRHPPRAPSEIEWDPGRGLVRPEDLEGFDAIVHLAGENLAAGRWSAGRKRRLRESRVTATARLSASLAGLDRPPGVLVLASAIGFYGNRGEEILTEVSAAGCGFLADLVRDWEAAGSAAAARGVRVVPLRFGVVLTPDGGALARLLPAFRLGMGGPIGDGRSWWSWIARDDVVGLIHFAITRGRVRGPVNAVAPEAARNSTLARSLARVLRRPAWFPLPAFALRIAFGEMADEALLSSARVRPARALAEGYRFRLPTLEPALAHLLGGRFDDVAAAPADGGAGAPA